MCYYPELSQRLIANLSSTLELYDRVELAHTVGKCIIYLDVRKPDLDGYNSVHSEIHAPVNDVLEIANAFSKPRQTIERKAYREVFRAEKLKIMPHDIPVYPYYICQQHQDLSDKPFAIYRNMVVKSHGEAAIASELERRNLVFSTNPNFRCGTGDSRKTYQFDFLVFAEGKLGVIEVDGNHHSKQHIINNDAAKEWVMKSQGVHVFHRAPYELAKKTPALVVDEFLNKISQLNITNSSKFVP